MKLKNIFLITVITLVFFACTNNRQQKTESTTDEEFVDKSVDELIDEVNNSVISEMSNAATPIEEPPAADGILMLNDYNFYANIKQGTFLVDFYADWCKPCKSMHPILVEFAKNYSHKIKVCKINVDNAPQASATYKVTGIPCLIVFKDGTEVKRMVGYHDFTGLTTELAEYIK